MKVKKSIWIAGIGAVVLLAGVLLPTLTYRAQDEKPVADIEIVATEVTLERNGAEAFSNVAPLTAEEHQQLFEELHALRLEMARKKVLVPVPAEAIAHSRTGNKTGSHRRSTCGAKRPLHWR